MRALAVSVVLSVLACGKVEQSNSIVVVRVFALEGTPTVTQLRVVATNAGVSETKMYPESPVAAGIQFDTSFALSLSTSRVGDLKLAVAALDAASGVIAAGETTVSIVPGGRTDANVDLHLVSTGDAGAPLSDAPSADMPGPTKTTDGPQAADLPWHGPDLAGTGGRLGTGGVSVVTATGGATTIVGAGGAAGSASGRGGSVAVGNGGMTSISGHGGSTTPTTLAPGELSSYSFPASSEPCKPTKDISGGQSGSFGTKDGFCFRTADDFEALACSNASDRTLAINGVPVTLCNGARPAKLGSFYYFDFGPGAYEYATVLWYCLSKTCAGVHPVPACGHYPPWQSGATVGPCADAPAP